MISTSGHLISKFLEVRFHRTRISISIADLDLLTIGLVNDMFTERRNDDYPYKELASQSDFDRF